jgi:hypothetical protein
MAAAKSYIHYKSLSSYFTPCVRRVYYVPRRFRQITSQMAGSGSFVSTTLRGLQQPPKNIIVNTIYPLSLSVGIPILPKDVSAL